MLADMHTHSVYSHDSVCPIEDMCEAQLKNGTAVAAVTDHADIFSYNDYDIFEPIKKAYDTVKELNKKYDGKILILSGVEIGEGAWFPQVRKKMEKLVDYDVIIGSVHCVKYKELTMPYSGIDFSELSENTIYAFLDAYFDDVTEMTETADFDILAHLTCPIRYITGKYKIKIDMEGFKTKIDNILKKIIKQNIALEVNTSGYDMLNDFFPSYEIIKRYHDMGGELLTLGSDAHIAQNASKNFEKAISFIKETGFKRLYYYQDRKPVAYEF